MFGTKVVTATYYRSDCENSLYYHTYKPMSSALSRKIWCRYLSVWSYWHLSFHIT